MHAAHHGLAPCGAPRQCTHELLALDYWHGLFANAHAGLCIQVLHAQELAYTTGTPCYVRLGCTAWQTTRWRVCQPIPHDHM